MAGLLRNVSFLKRSVLHPEIFSKGLLSASSQLNEFSTKGGKKKKKKKAVALDPGDENLSAKDLALKEALKKIKASFGDGAIRWLGRSEGLKEGPVVSTNQMQPCKGSTEKSCEAEKKDVNLFRN